MHDIFDYTGIPQHTMVLVLLELFLDSLATGADFKVDAKGLCNNYLEAGLGNG